MAKEGRAQGADGLFRVDEDGGGKRKVSLLDAKVGLALVGVARKTCTNKLLGARLTRVSLAVDYPSPLPKLISALSEITATVNYLFDCNQFYLCKGQSL